jgi:CHAT domain-containing protein
VRSNHSIQVIELGPTAPIYQAIQQWRSTIETRMRPVMEANDAAVQLRRCLWEPLEKHLDGCRTVLLSPDGLIHFLPFGALPGSRPDRFLAEELSLVVIPVPQLLPELLEARTVNLGPSLLVIGDVDYEAESGPRADPKALRGNEVAATLADKKYFRWNRLPASGAEAQTISHHFAQRFRHATVTMLLKEHASETAFCQQAGRHRFLHLATHGFLAHREARPVLMPAHTVLDEGRFSDKWFVEHQSSLLSALTFAGANRPPQLDHDDGILTASEVAHLDLRGVDLAVLSACETGLGNVAGGEGVFGLQRAFQVAGARSVITSLWKVDDEATAALMSLFYYKLWCEQKPTLQALREAQLAIHHHPERIPALAKERGPNFEKVVKLPVAPAPAEKSDRKAPVKQWAGFVLSGAWR